MDEVETRWVPWVEFLNGIGFGLYYHESDDEQYAETGIEITIYMDFMFWRFALTKCTGIFDDESD